MNEKFQFHVNKGFYFTSPCLPERLNRAGRQGGRGPSGKDLRDQYLEGARSREPFRTIVERSKPKESRYHPKADLAELVLGQKTKSQQIDPSKL